MVQEYQAVQLQLQKIRITTYFVILEPDCADIILGIQWLRTLGKCEVDWEQQEFSFKVNNEKITLFGNPHLHGQLGMIQLDDESRQVNFSSQSMSLEAEDKSFIMYQIA